MQLKIDETHVNRPPDTSTDRLSAKPPTHAFDISALEGRMPDTAAREESKPCLAVRDLNLYYGEKQALNNVNMVIPAKQVTAFIGPSGCGKSTLIRCFNRMNDLYDNVRINGSIFLHYQDIYA